MKELTLQGCGTALFTPFKKDGSVDFEAFAAGVVDLLDRRWKEILQKAGN